MFWLLLCNIFYVCANTNTLAQNFVNTSLRAHYAGNVYSLANLWTVKTKFEGRCANQLEEWVHRSWADRLKLKELSAFGVTKIMVTRRRFQALDMSRGMKTLLWSRPSTFPWVTKTKFIQTKLIQCQADKWWEKNQLGIISRSSSEFPKLTS